MFDSGFGSQAAVTVAASSLEGVPISAVANTKRIAFCHRVRLITADLSLAKSSPHRKKLRPIATVLELTRVHTTHLHAQERRRRTEIRKLIGPNPLRVEDPGGQEGKTCASARPSTRNHPLHSPRGLEFLWKIAVSMRRRAPWCVPGGCTSGRRSSRLWSEILAADRGPRDARLRASAAESRSGARATRTRNRHAVLQPKASGRAKR
jgi:hypothetical protein